MVHHFDYRDNQLFAEDVAINLLAADVGTPFYCYSNATLTRHYNVINRSFAEACTKFGLKSEIYFAAKANSNQAVLRTLSDLGCGADIVSMGELLRCRHAGFAGKKIIFSGVGKTETEITTALEHKIGCFNVESMAELFEINQIAASLDCTAPVSLRLTPDIDADTHEKITTGTTETKFGIPYTQAADAFDAAVKLDHLDARGIDCHIGSQIMAIEPFAKTFSLLREIYDDLTAKGHDIDHINIGGGLGIHYHDDTELPPSLTDYAEAAATAFAGTGITLRFEPGRLIAGNAGVLVTKVIRLKQTSSKEFIIVDAAMNDLMRPTLYDAHHAIIPIRQNQNENSSVIADIVGPVCESGDYLARDRRLAIPAPGDYLAVLSCGAYSAVLASTYNSRLLVPEVMVKGNEYSIVRPRKSYEDMLNDDNMASWQRSGE